MTTPAYVITTSLNRSKFYNHVAVWCDGRFYHINENGVHCDTFDDFMAGRELLYTTAATQTPDEIREYYLTNKNRKHNLVFFNCEHFANGAAFGVEKSPTLIGYILTTVCALILIVTHILMK